jgi:ABC-type amino acid transport substrate-binding protein
MCDTFNIVVGFITILSSVFGLYQFNEKRKLKIFTVSVLQGSAGNLCKIQQSTEWAFKNFREIQKLAVELSDSEIKKDLIKKVSDGQGDAAAADRLVINLFEQFMTIQESQFGSKEIKHPEKHELNLWLKELESRKYK